jgi:hypothetical protein
MAVLWLLWACGGAPPAPLRSQPVPPTRDLSTPALVLPGDSPIAQFVPKGAPAWPTGPLGKLAPGLPLDEVRRIGEAIRDPHRVPPDATPAAGMIGVAGRLDGFEDIGFIAMTKDGKLISLDLTSRIRDWDGVLEAAWGPGTPGKLTNGAPSMTWVNAETGLTVLQVHDPEGRIVVQWAASGPALPKDGSEAR